MLSSGPDRGPTILLIDNSASDLQLLKTNLRMHGIAATILSGDSQIVAQKILQYQQRHYALYDGQFKLL